MARSKTIQLINVTNPASFTTGQMECEFSTVVSFAIRKTGNLAGTVTIEQSHDGTNWLATSTTGTLTAGTNPQLVSVSITPTIAPFYRLVSASITGSGALTVIGFLRDNG